MPRSTKVLAVRLPIPMALAIERRAAAQGVTLNAMLTAELQRLGRDDDAESGRQEAGTKRAGTSLPRP